MSSNISSKMLVRHPKCNFSSKNMTHSIFFVDRPKLYIIVLYLIYVVQNATSPVWSPRITHFYFCGFLIIQNYTLSLYKSFFISPPVLYFIYIVYDFGSSKKQHIVPNCVFFCIQKYCWMKKFIQSGTFSSKTRFG